MKSIAGIQIASLIFGALSFGAQAQTPAPQFSDSSTLLGARAVGRGSSTVASTTYHDALFQNPAGSVFTQSYAVSLGYLGLGDSLTASVVDTKSGALGGGVYYLRRDMRDVSREPISIGDYARLEERAGLALFGKPSDGFGIGISAKYAYRKSLSEGIGSGKNWNGDIGAKYLVNGALTVGATGQNLLVDESGLNPKSVILGAEYGLGGGFSVSAQVSRILTSGFARDTSWGTGGEYRLSNGFALRAGYRDNRPWDEQTIAGGAGYDAKSFSVDYSVSSMIKGRAGTVHSLVLAGYL